MIWTQLSTVYSYYRAVASSLLLTLWTRFSGFCLTRTFASSSSQRSEILQLLLQKRVDLTLLCEKMNQQTSNCSSLNTASQTASANPQTNSPHPLEQSTTKSLPSGPTQSVLTYPDGTAMFSSSTMQSTTSTQQMLTK